ncbi:MAG: 2-C-methyl-D-erythritol 4-phosphate cytidylyltransferase [Erysipelothrix sp.]|nr:2-C-methyl-D-erythritol 4-phosphate cytidylyltransferase [Erysipelothrix sp.]
MNYTALIVAAGKGTRTGLGYNKMFYVLKKYQMTVLEKTTKLFLDDDRCTQVVIVTNPVDMKDIVLGHENEKIVHVNGGPRRQDSVLQGLMATREEVVLIHDGARPWLEMENVNALLEAMETERAAVLAVKLKDTIKVVKDGYIHHTIDREQLMSAQTPQAFNTDLIIECYIKAKNENIFATDDAQIVEMCSNIKIKVVEGSYLNNKITTKDYIDKN